VTLGFGRVHGPHGKQLTGVVPLVQGLGGVDPLVALESDQPAPQQLGEHLRHLGLADPGLALQQ
jgi:hypothetical protein